MSTVSTLEWVENMLMQAILKRPILMQQAKYYSSFRIMHWCCIFLHWYASGKWLRRLLEVWKQHIVLALYFEQLPSLSNSLILIFSFKNKENHCCIGLRQILMCFQAQQLLIYSDWIERDFRHRMSALFSSRKPSWECRFKNGRAVAKAALTQNI